MLAYQHHHPHHILLIFPWLNKLSTVLIVTSIRYHSIIMPPFCYFPTISHSFRSSTLKSFVRCQVSLPRCTLKASVLHSVFFWFLGVFWKHFDGKASVRRAFFMLNFVIWHSVMPGTHASSFASAIQHLRGIKREMAASPSPRGQDGDTTAICRVSCTASWFKCHIKHEIRWLVPSEARWYLLIGWFSARLVISFNRFKNVFIYYK